MKKLLPTVLSLSLFFLAACSDDDEVKKVSPQNSESTQTNELQSLPFRSFGLDVDYSKFTSFEVEYDNDEEGIEAKIEDEVNKKVYKGDEAYQKIQKYLNKLQFDENTADTDVLKELKRVFEITDDYQKIELEVTFSNGIEKEYHFMP